jgi:hypothetical protein
MPRLRVAPRAKIQPFVGEDSGRQSDVKFRLFSFLVIRQSTSSLQIRKHDRHVNLSSLTPSCLQFKVQTTVMQVKVNDKMHNFNICPSFKTLWQPGEK